MPSVTTRKEQAYDHILRQFEAGRLLAGDRLSEAALARDIRVSRGPLREAMNQLASEGLVDQIPGFGAFVKRPNREQVVDMFEVRQVLECFAAAKAAERITPEQLARLESFCSQLHDIADQAGRDRAMEEAERVALLDADFGFHDTVAEAAGNGEVRRQLSRYWLVGRLLHYEPSGQISTPETRSRTWAGHVEILRALQQHDEDAARTAMQEHLRHAWRVVIGSYDAMERRLNGDDGGS